MRTNLFRPKSVKKDKITIEEERLDSPLLLLFKKYGCLAVLFFFLIIFIIIGLILFTISNLSSSGDDNYADKDLSFLYGDDNVVIGGENNDDDWIDKYANAYKKEGIIFVVKSFEVPGGVVTYYSDYSSKLVRSDGTIVRISKLPKGKYGIDENGVINSNSKRKTIYIVNKEELESGTVIVRYSDGSAEITKDGKTILVRNGSRINLTDDKVDLDDVGPSGASYPLKKDKKGNYEIIYYTDGTIKISDGSNTYVVRNDEDIIINGNDISFPNHNEAKIIRVLKLDDGTVITYYSDGSALIESFYDTDIMVRRSRDIVLDGKNSFLEILEGDDAYAVYTRKCPNGDEVTYYDDGSAVIRYKKDGKSVYIDENSNIKFDANGNIKDIKEDVSKEKKVITTPDDTKITYFDNGLSRIENGDVDYITRTKDITLDKDGNLIDDYDINKYNLRDKPKDDTNHTDDTPLDEVDGDVTGRIEDIDDNYYNFIINNDSKSTINYKLVLEETSNYERYGYQDKILLAKYIKYDLMFEDNSYEGVNLNSNVWPFNGKTNYVLYEGSLSKKSELDVMLKLYFDYADLDNSMQDHWFIGTIKLYIEK